MCDGVSGGGEWREDEKALNINVKKLRRSGSHSKHFVEMTRGNQPDYVG
jgi:hypothetical protein